MDKAARSMAALDATVVGIDTDRLIGPLRGKAEGCFYQAWEFEGLSKIVQKTLEFKGYHLPVLAGFGEGAAVAYATFAQAPKDSFAGAITLGFSPRLAIGKPFCTANGSLPTAPRADPRRNLPPVVQALLAVWRCSRAARTPSSAPEAKAFASKCTARA
jgi:type IV secretory pathway VirJ component